MAPNNKLTPVEWEIMEAVWNMQNPPSVRDVLEKLYPNGEKAYTTVQTIMNTLVKKGMLDTEKIGLVNFYKPVESRKDMVKSEISSVASRIFKGSVPAMANYLIDSQELSMDEIQKIKALLREKEKNLKDDK